MEIRDNKAVHPATVGGIRPGTYSQPLSVSVSAALILLYFLYESYGFLFFTVCQLFLPTLILVYVSPSFAFARYNPLYALTLFSKVMYTLQAIRGLRARLRYIVIRGLDQQSYC